MGFVLVMTGTVCPANAGLIRLNTERGCDRQYVRVRIGASVRTTSDCDASRTEDVIGIDCPGGHRLHLKSRLGRVTPIGRCSIRSATTFTTPSAFSSRPRTS